MLLKQNRVRLIDYLTVDISHPADANRRTARKQSAFPLANSIAATLSSGNSTLRRVRDEIIEPLFADPRQDQHKELATNLDEEKLYAAEQALNRELAVAATSLGFATLGSLLYLPLSYLSIPGLCWLAGGFYRDAYHAYKKKQSRSKATMSATFITGAIITGHLFAASLGASVYRISRKLLLKTEDLSRQSLIDVFGYHKRTAWLLHNHVEIEVAVETLKSGDVIVVHAGETIPVDGLVTEGEAAIDQRILTGESQPVEKEIGDQVFASTIVLSGKILVEVEKAGQDTVAAQIGNILNQTADFKSSIQTWGEEIVNRSSLLLLLLAGGTLPLLGATAALTILNTSLGFYMIVLGPLGMLSFLNLASKRGILIKDGRSLQLLTDVDTVVFDKTGTLTLEEPHVGQIYACAGFDEATILTYAAAAEYKQTHPIARAIRQQAVARNLDIPAIKDAQYAIGYGLKVHLLQGHGQESSSRFQKLPAASEIAANSPVISGRSSNKAISDATDRCQTDQLIRVGSYRFMQMENIAIPSEIAQRHLENHERGHSLVYVAVDDRLAGVIELHATIRPEARDVIQTLRKRGLSMAIISGDHEKPTHQLAQTLGIEQYFAETLPENKAEIIGQLQAEGKSICFVGDGINDSIALKKANVSISLRGASSAATDAAQIVLMHQDLNQLLEALDVASAFKANMKFNLVVTVMPGIITLYGVFFLGFGIVHAIALNATSLFVGTSNAVWPWLREQKKISHGQGNAQPGVEASATGSAVQLPNPS